MEQQSKVTSPIAITLKGRAVLSAIDAGLCCEDEDGYEVGPFLKFWEDFEPQMNAALENKIQEVFDQERQHRAKQDKKNLSKEIATLILLLLSLSLNCVLLLLINGA